MKLEKFLFCITLETAGLVLGFLGVFFCGFILLVLIGGYIILISVFSSSDFENGNKEDMMIVVYGKYMLT